MELKQKLTLYQVFLKLYEHNRELLDDILKLENTDTSDIKNFTTPFMTGIVNDSQAFLITNLLDSKTKCLFQPQHLWTIGRGKSSTIAIPDKLLSRYHAAVQYIKNQGFYLADIDSTNGTFVNQRLITEPVLLKDGDCIRMGSSVFNFFLAEAAEVLEEIPPPVLDKLEEANIRHPHLEPQKNLMPEEQSETFIFLRQQPEDDDLALPHSIPNLNAAQREAILERYFGRGEQRN